MPVISIVVSLVLGVFVFAFNFYGSTMAQAQEIEKVKTEQKQIREYLSERRIERDKQFDALDKTVLKRELFEVYHETDAKRMERMEKALERIEETIAARGKY